MVSLESDFNIKLINDYLSPSNIYGFILFTDEHPYMKKVMRDEDFWLEFNEKSGVYWPIFSVKTLHKQDISYNRKVLNFFNLNNTENDLPCLIIFALDSNNEELAYQRTYKINGNSIDEVHNSIKKAIESVADIEKTIRESDNTELRSTPFVAWEASKSLDKLEVKDCIRHGFYGLGKVSNFVYSVIKILHI